MNAFFFSMFLSLYLFVSVYLLLDESMSTNTNDKLPKQASIYAVVHQKSDHTTKITLYGFVVINRVNHSYFYRHYFLCVSALHSLSYIRFHRHRTWCSIWNSVFHWPLFPSFSFSFRFFHSSVFLSSPSQASECISSGTLCEWNTLY